MATGARKPDGVRRPAECARGIAFGYERRLTGRGKECQDGERFKEFAGAVRERFYRRRRLVRAVAVTSRIGKGTSCPVARL